MRNIKGRHKKLLKRANADWKVQQQPVNFPKGSGVKLPKEDKSPVMVIFPSGDRRASMMSNSLWPCSGQLRCLSGQVTGHLLACF